MKKETEDYSKVFTEVDEIFKHLPEDMLKKIPAKLKKEVAENKNDEYQFKYDRRRKLMNQQIFSQTKDFISLIYIIYICNKEEKREMLEICRNSEKAVEEQKKKDYEEAVKKQVEDTEDKGGDTKDKKAKTALTVEKKDWFKKLIEKIKNFFKKTLDKSN